MTARLLAALARDRRGVAAVEFAFIAPLLVLFYFGCVELSVMLSMDRKITNMASALGDLVAQDDVVDADEVEDIFAAAKAIMEPDDPEVLRLRVSSVLMDDDGVATVQWSSAKNWTARTCDESVTPPEGVLEEGESMILAEVEMSYVSPIKKVLTGSYELEKTFYLRPRRADLVVYTPAPC